MPSPSSASRSTKTRHRRTARWIKRGALAAVGAAILAALVYAWIPKPVVVDVAVVRRAPLDVEVVEDGQTRVADRFVVYAPLAGELVRIELDPGMPVEVGQRVAAIAPSAAALLDPRTRNEVTARIAAAQARERALSTRIDRARSSATARCGPGPRSRPRSRPRWLHGAASRARVCGC